MHSSMLLNQCGILLTAIFVLTNVQGSAQANETYSSLTVDYSYFAPEQKIFDNTPIDLPFPREDVSRKEVPKEIPREKISEEEIIPPDYAPTPLTLPPIVVDETTQPVAADETPSPVVPADAPQPVIPAEVAAPVVPVQVTPAVISPIIPPTDPITTWRGRAGEPIQDVMKRWADREQINLEWQSTQNPVLKKTFSYVGTFEEAVSALIKSTTDSPLTSEMIN
jgi:hypothetical protein